MLSEQTKTYLRSFLKPEVLVAALVVVSLAWAMSSYKINNWYWQRADAAVLYQATDSIARTGSPHSGVFATTTAFYFDARLPTTPAAKLSQTSLAPPPSLNDNPFGGHEYLILYPIALIARMIPSNVLLLVITVLCFVGMLPIVYYELRARRVPIVTAILFCVLVASHAAWSDGLLFGQVYPDRFFVLAGLVLMFLTTRDRTNRPAILGAAVLCAMVNERGALIAGLFMVAYALLYWKAQPRERIFKIGVGAVLLVYSMILFKFVLVNPIYAQNSPSIGNIFAMFQRPNFAQTTEMMFLVSAPLLVLALFEWRAAAIALFLMMPNVMTNIGGAEKIGWSTHYSSFYLPAVVWAGVLGCAAMYRYAARYRSSGKELWLKVAGSAGVALLIVFSVTLDPDGWSKPAWSGANVASSFLGRLNNYVPGFVGRAGTERRKEGEIFGRSVGDGPLVVSSVEQGMPLLYDKTSATLLYFPFGLDTADYAVMAAYQPQGKPIFFYGTVSFLGADEQKATNAALTERMKKDGYDFAHAVFSPALGVALIKRDHGK